MINGKGMEYDIRPWGRYDVLEDASDYKVKRIVVKPGQRNSYQRHQKRAECWMIVSGKGRFLVNDVWIEVGPQEVIYISRGSKHRWHNSDTEDLVMIEVQTGTYFGEDDEERIEDDYGREGTVSVPSFLPIPNDSIWFMASRKEGL